MTKHEVVKGWVTNPHGLDLRCEVHVYSRGGSKSEPLWMIHVGEFRITPFQARLEHWWLDMNTALKAFYGPKLVIAMFYDHNPLYALVK